MATVSQSCGAVTSKKRLHYFKFTQESLNEISQQDYEVLKDDENRERIRRFRKRVCGMTENYANISVPTATLISGKQIPLIGLGTWKSEKGGVFTAVQNAIRCGYRHIDCAEYYGNEDEVGEALEVTFGEGVVQRKDVFITSKLWNTNHAGDRVKPALLKILKNLKLNYLDLLLIHWPVTGNHGKEVEPPIRETWEAMEKLVDEGLILSIGVSNFSVPKLQDILTYCRVKPAVNQIERHPYFRNDKTVEWCKANDIHVTAFAPLGSPDSANFLGRKLTVNLLTHPLVEGIAQQLHKNPGQVLIRWGLQSGTSVLPKSINPKRIQTNLDVIDWELPPADYKSISSFDSQLRMVDGSYWLSSNGPYKKLSDLWDDPDEDDRLERFVPDQYDSDVSVPLVHLGKDLQMPILGLGTWRSEPGEVKQAVMCAIRAGYRHIDCAHIYENEAEVGEALKQIWSEGVVERKDLWITSKLWNASHGKMDVRPAALKTLKNLGIEYLDLYLIHWPVTEKAGPVLEPSLEETWLEMEALVNAGLVRAIGVSNFSTKKLQTILDCAEIKPAVNQVECHPYFRNDGLLQFCNENGVHLSAYSPLGGAPENEDFVKIKLPRLLQDPIVNSIAEKLEKSPAQVIIRWGVQHNTSVLPKSSKPKRIKENLDIFSWSLDDDDYSKLSNLSPQMRMLDGNFFLSPAGPYKTLDDLWDE